MKSNWSFSGQQSQRCLRRRRRLKTSIEQGLAEWVEDINIRPAALPNWPMTFAVDRWRLFREWRMDDMVRVTCWHRFIVMVPSSSSLYLFPWVFFFLFNYFFRASKGIYFRLQDCTIRALNHHVKSRWSCQVSITIHDCNHQLHGTISVLVCRNWFNCRDWCWC